MVRAASVYVTSIVMMIVVVAAPAQSQNRRLPYRLIPIVPAAQANAINDRGQVVGEHVTMGQVHAFAWWKGATLDLGVLPGGNFSVAYDINDRGQVVGAGNTGIGTVDRAILWRDGTAVDLGTLPGGDRSSANAVNNRGVIAGFSTDQNSAFRPVVWTRGQPVDLGTPQGYASGVAVDINEPGQAAGWAFNELGYRAVLWQAGAAIDLGMLPGDTDSFALGLNNRGQVVGLSRNVQAGTVRACMWEGDVMLELAAPPGAFSWAEDVNNRGRVAGTLNPTSIQRAAVHDGGVFQPLPETEASMALAINSRGDIVGVSGSTAVLWVRAH
jgi:probable HAF family extracellular repeat protein